MPVHITYSGTNAKLKQAAADATAFLQAPLTQLLAQRAKPFVYSKPATLTPQQIDGLVKTTNLPLTLKQYKGPSGVNGAFDPKYPSMLFYNSNALDRLPCAITSTLVHESIHALDKKLTAYDFGHSDAGRDDPNHSDTAPYWIGDRAKNLLCGKSLTDEPLVIELIDDASRPAFEASIIEE